MTGVLGFIWAGCGTLVLDQPGKEDNMLKFITHLGSETPVSISHHFGTGWTGQEEREQGQPRKMRVYASWLSGG